MTITVSVVENVMFRVKCRGHEIVADQTRDEAGTDAGMTPLELLGASLAACVTYYVVVFCRRREIPTSGLEVGLDWNMADDPYRVKEFDIKIHLPVALSDVDRAVLFRMAQSCTVHNTLSHSPTINISL